MLSAHLLVVAAPLHLVFRPHLARESVEGNADPGQLSGHFSGLLVGVVHLACAPLALLSSFLFVLSLGHRLPSMSYQAAITAAITSAPRAPTACAKVAAATCFSPPWASGAAASRCIAKVSSAFGVVRPARCRLCARELSRCAGKLASSLSSARAVALQTEGRLRGEVSTLYAVECGRE